MFKVRCIQPGNPGDPLGHLLQVGEVYQAEESQSAHDNYLIHFSGEALLFKKSRFQLVGHMPFDCSCCGKGE